MAFSPDGHSIASTSTDGTIRIWNVEDGRCLQIIREYSCISYNVSNTLIEVKLKDRKLNSSMKPSSLLPLLTSSNFSF
ncbi:hypothetical protein HW132_17160 [Brasilonema sp. CT11]|nr:hypothetical protein [Brasilonema sp. CT11]